MLVSFRLRCQPSKEFLLYVCLCIYILLVWCNQNMLGRSISGSPYFFVAAEIIWFVPAMWHRPWVKTFQDGCQKSLWTEATCWIKQRDATSLLILQFGGLTSETIFNSTNRWCQKWIPFWQKDRWRKTGSLEPLLTLMWYFYFFNHGLSTVRLLFYMTNLWSFLETILNMK